MQFASEDIDILRETMFAMLAYFTGTDSYRFLENEWIASVSNSYDRDGWWHLLHEEEQMIAQHEWGDAYPYEYSINMFWEQSNYAHSGEGYPYTWWDMRYSINRYNFVLRIPIKFSWGRM